MSRRPIPMAGPVAAVASPIVAYTPTITQTGNTFTSASGGYMRLPGGLLIIWGQFTAQSTVAAAFLTISLPTGFTTFAPSNIGAGFGVGSVGCTSTNQNQTLFPPGLAATTANAFIACTAAAVYVFFATIPVNGA